MVGEIDRDGLVRATHRLIEEGVESPALLALSLADQDERADLGTAVERLMGEIGLAAGIRARPASCWPCMRPPRSSAM